MLFSIKTQIKRYLDLLLFGVFIAILAISILGMKSVDVRSPNVTGSGSSSQVPSDMPSEWPSLFPIYLPAVQK